MASSLNEYVLFHAVSLSRSAADGYGVLPYPPQTGGIVWQFILIWVRVAASASALLKWPFARSDWRDFPSGRLCRKPSIVPGRTWRAARPSPRLPTENRFDSRSEEHTSEL